ncbi:MAG: HAD family hydrolase [Parcubacteria group bacterium]|nr:HAD family hydrolase [Parcubacteria group bacterium]
MGYKTIFIDWFNTLSDSLFWSQLFVPNHPYNCYHKEITKYIFLENPNLSKDWMLGKFSSEDICKKISFATGIKYEIILSTLKESCMNMRLANDRVLPVVQEIRDMGVSVVIATDNMDTFRRFTVSSLGLENYFDNFLVSNELQVVKYQTEQNAIPFFDDYLKKNSLTYKDVVLLDDCDDKTGVYKKLGFKIELVDSPSSLLNILKKYLN